MAHHNRLFKSESEHKQEPLTQEEINKLRHPYELTIYFFMATLNAVILFVIIGAVMMIPFKQLWQYLRFGDAYLMAVGVIVVSFIGMGMTFSGAKVQAVRVDERQFPELYARLRLYSHLLGLKKIPALYVKQENGTLNAFASYFWGRNYVVLNTELFEISYMEHKDMDAVAFVLAHELAHIRLYHTRFWYNVSVFFIRLIPFVGPLLSRANEFSSDNLAKAVCPQGAHGIFVLLVGRHLFRDVDVREYLLQAKDTKGLFEAFINAKSSHPVNTRRVLSLYGNGKGRLLF